MGHTRHRKMTCGLCGGHAIMIMVQQGNDYLCRCNSCGHQYKTRSKAAKRTYESQWEK